MIVVGIDYSISCPCLCVHTGDTFDLKNCQFHYLTDKKKFQIPTGRFLGYPHSMWESPEQRYDQISDWAISKIPNGSLVFMEGYSFGSRAGLMLNIAENASLLKHKMYMKKIQFELVPPTVVKKFLSGKGNARKEVMVESFIKITGFDIYAELNTNVAGNPVSDVVDSYALASYGFNKATESS